MTGQTVAWPAGVPWCPEPRSARGGPVENRRSFATDSGLPIERPRHTAMIERWSVHLALMSQAQAEDLRQWFATVAGFGAAPFLWRHPLSGAVGRWRIAQDSVPLDHEEVLRDRVRVSMVVIRLPGTPWFAPYVPDGTVRLPLWVADYDAGKYWVAGVPVAAGDLDQIAGSYDVLTRLAPWFLAAGEWAAGGRWDDGAPWDDVTPWADSGDQMSQESYAGDVPQAAPPGVLWLAGFAP